MPTPNQSHHARRRAALESALVALIVALLCSLLVDTLGELAPLRFVRKATWDWLSSRLDSRAQGVVVVDVSSIRRPSNAEGQPVTDRAQLLEIVMALRAAGARSIGIDIDFSFEGGEPVSESDPHLLAVLAGMRDDGGPPVVVHVGVGRGLRSPSAEWLGDPSLAKLGAAIAADASDNRLMPLSLTTPWGEKLPPLGVATALPCLKDAQLPERGATGLASAVHEAEDSGLRLESFFVDFSTVPDLLDTRLPAASRDAELDPDQLLTKLQEDLGADPSPVRGKAVFVGYADPAHMQDNGFVMPGHLRALPGIYAHAAAAAALLGPGWLYEPTALLDVILDVGLVLLLISTIYFLRSRIWRRWGEQDELALHPLLTALLLVITWLWLAPWLLVSQFRVIPHGLPIVTLSLLVELLWVPILVLVHGGSHGKEQEEGPMRKDRVNVLIVVAGLLVVGVAAKLMFHEHGGAAPPQPPLTRQVLAGMAPAAAEHEPTAVKLSLIEYVTTRGGSQSPEAVGPRFIGTDSRDAAELWRQAEAAETAGENAKAARLAHEGLVHDPDFPQLLVIAAVAELACGDERVQEAERLARRATELAPMYAVAHFNLACALARQSLAKETAAELALTIRWFDGTRMGIAAAVAKESDFDKVRDAPEVRAVLQEP